LKPWNELISNEKNNLDRTCVCAHIVRDDLLHRHDEQKDLPGAENQQSPLRFSPHELAQSANH
jgi:hypothetical protein